MSLDKEIEKSKDENKVNLEITVKQTKTSWVKQALVTAGITIVGIIASAVSVFKVYESKMEEAIDYRVKQIEEKFDYKADDLEKNFKRFFYETLEEIPGRIKKEFKKEYDKFWEKYDNDYYFRQEINRKFWDRLNEFAKDYEWDEQDN